jgi:hypothetical protein
VYRARLVVFVISVLLAWIESLSKGYVFHGQGHKDHKKRVIDLLRRVAMVSVGTMRITKVAKGAVGRARNGSG